LTTDWTDPNETRIYRWGGVAAIALALSYLVITVLYIQAGAVPSGGGEAWLQYLATRTTAWWAILGLSVLTDVLFLPMCVALHLALRSIDRSAALAGVGLLALFALLDLAVTWPNYAALITLSGDYAAAGTDVERGPVVAAAAYAVSVLDSTVWAAYAILIPALGILVLGLLMRTGPFGRGTAYLGLVTGIFGMIAVIGGIVWGPLGTLAIPTSILTTVWVLIVGIRLLRLGRVGPA
jgi:hypothetical protein